MWFAVVVDCSLRVFVRCVLFVDCRVDCRFCACLVACCLVCATIVDCCLWVGVRCRM